LRWNDDQQRFEHSSTHRRWNHDYDGCPLAMIAVNTTTVRSRRYRKHKHGKSNVIRSHGSGSSDGTSSNGMRNDNDNDNDSHEDHYYDRVVPGYLLQFRLGGSDIYPWRYDPPSPSPSSASLTDSSSKDMDRGK
jgi:hypothetical protein